MDKKLQEYKDQLHKEIDDIKSWDDFYINISWSVEDVKDCAVESDPKIAVSTEEAVEILRDLYYNHDFEWGLTWDTISSRLCDLEESRHIEDR